MREQKSPLLPVCKDYRSFEIFIFYKLKFIEVLYKQWESLYVHLTMKTNQAEIDLLKSEQQKRIVQAYATDRAAY